MDLGAVMDEVARVLEQITGLRVSAWPQASVSGASGYVSYPEMINYDQTYGAGSDEYVGLPLVLLVPRPDSRGAREAVARWSRGDGEGVRALIANWPWTTCDFVQVTGCKFEVETIAGVDYLAAVFTATVAGPGKE